MLWTPSSYQGMFWGIFGFYSTFKKPAFSRPVWKPSHFVASVCSTVILPWCCREDTHNVGTLACGYLLLKMQKAVKMQCGRIRHPLLGALNSITNNCKSERDASELLPQQWWSESLEDRLFRKNEVHTLLCYSVILSLKHFSIFRNRFDCLKRPRCVSYLGATSCFDGQDDASVPRCPWFKCLS